MLNGVDAATDRFLTALDRINRRADRAQQQISSGLRVTTASDDPDQVSALLLARSELNRTVQVGANLSRIKAEVDTAEQSLGITATLLERVNQVGVQAANSTQTPRGRQTIAVEVSAALDHLVAVANTTVEGRYIFSGDKCDTPAYSVDLTQPNGVSEYGGGEATRQAADSSGSRFSVAKSAQQIFDAPTASVFAAVNQMRLALENGPTVPVDDPAYTAQLQAQSDAIGAALLAVRAAQDHLGIHVSYYGAVQNRIEEAANTTNQLELRQTSALSTIRDADIAAAATELTQANTQRNAALQAHALKSTRSLFDYLG